MPRYSSWQTRTRTLNHSPMSRGSHGTSRRPPGRGRPQVQPSMYDHPQEWYATHLYQGPSPSMNRPPVGSFGPHPSQGPSPTMNRTPPTEAGHQRLEAPALSTNETLQTSAGPPHSQPPQLSNLSEVLTFLGHNKAWGLYAGGTGFLAEQLRLGEQNRSGGLNHSSIVTITISNSDDSNDAITRQFTCVDVTSTDPEADNNARIKYFVENNSEILYNFNDMKQRFEEERRAHLAVFKEYLETREKNSRLRRNIEGHEGTIRSHSEHIERLQQQIQTQQDMIRTKNDHIELKQHNEQTQRLRENLQAQIDENQRLVSLAQRMKPDILKMSLALADIAKSDLLNQSVSSVAAPGRRPIETQRQPAAILHSMPREPMNHLVRVSSGGAPLKGEAQQNVVPDQTEDRFSCPKSVANASTDAEEGSGLVSDRQLKHSFQGKPSENSPSKDDRRPGSVSLQKNDFPPLPPPTNALKHKPPQGVLPSSARKEGDNSRTSNEHGVAPTTSTDRENRVPQPQVYETNSIQPPPVTPTEQIKRVPQRQVHETNSFQKPPANPTDQEKRVPQRQVHETNSVQQPPATTSKLKTPTTSTQTNTSSHSTSPFGSLSRHQTRQNRVFTDANHLNESLNFTQQSPGADRRGSRSSNRGNVTSKTPCTGGSQRRRNLNYPMEPTPSPQGRGKPPGFSNGQRANPPDKSSPKSSAVGEMVAGNRFEPLLPTNETTDVPQDADSSTTPIRSDISGPVRDSQSETTEIPQDTADTVNGAGQATQGTLERNQKKNDNRNPKKEAAAKERAAERFLNNAAREGEKKRKKEANKKAEEAQKEAKAKAKAEKAEQAEKAAREAIERTGGRMYARSFENAVTSRWMERAYKAGAAARQETVDFFTQWRDNDQVRMETILDEETGECIDFQFDEKNNPARNEEEKLLQLCTKLHRVLLLPPTYKARFNLYRDCWDAISRDQDQDSYDFLAAQVRHVFELTSKDCEAPWNLEEEKDAVNILTPIQVKFDGLIDAFPDPRSAIDVLRSDLANKERYHVQKLTSLYSQSLSQNWDPLKAQQLLDNYFALGPDLQILITHSFGRATGELEKLRIEKEWPEIEAPTLEPYRKVFNDGRLNCKLIYLEDKDPVKGEDLEKGGDLEKDASDADTAVGSESSSDSDGIQPEKAVATDSFSKITTSGTPISRDPSPQ